VKTFSFWDLQRQAAMENKFLLASGRRLSNWPKCQTCGHDVDACELKNHNNSSVEIVARCHGKEDSCRVVFDFGAEGDAAADEGKAAWCIKRAMSDWGPFSPSHHDG
jgi:hypothetical protein